MHLLLFTHDHLSPCLLFPVRLLVRLYVLLLADYLARSLHIFLLLFAHDPFLSLIVYLLTGSFLSLVILLAAWWLGSMMCGRRSVPQFVGVYCLFRR
jgi:hypothetical protein